jgi:uncharacterized protein (TIGR02246 family)
MRWLAAVRPYRDERIRAGRRASDTPFEHNATGRAASSDAARPRPLVRSCEMRSIAPMLAIATLASCRPAALTEADRAAIVAVLDEQREAWNAGDIERFMQGYERSPEIVFTSGGKIRRGYDATLASYRDRYADDDAMGHLEFSDLEIQAVGGDAAVVLGRFELTETPRAGAGVFTVVFVRRDASWKIVHDHSSAIAEPAGQ